MKGRKSKYSSYMNNWLDKLNGNPIDWLLESNSWTKYRTLIDLLEKPEDSQEVINTKQKLENDPLITGILNDSIQWFQSNATRHDDSKLAHYKLRFLADLGFSNKDKQVQKIIAKAVEHTENGLFTIRQTLPVKGSLKGKEEWHALPCDSTILTYIFLKLGINNDLTQLNIDHLKEKWTTNVGWFCNLSFVNGQFKKQQIGCPMAGLMALEVFSLIPDLKESKFSKNAFEPLKFHKEYGQTLYYFGRSKKFRTLKYPFVWYNALYLADVLTRFDFVKDEPLLRELILWIEQSQTKEGKFIPNSMFTNYKGWDFADKKQPSPWITYLCCRILKKYYQIEEK